MSNASYGIQIDALIQPLTWSAILMVVALVIDALGRRRGEPEPPARTDVHAQIERLLREPDRLPSKAAAPGKRI